MTELLIVLLGFVAGAAGGLMGVGGGILFVPALTIVLDKTQIQGEATSLLAIMPVAIAGTWRQHRFGNVRFGDAAVIGALSPVGVLIGVVVANELSQRALEVSFALLALFVAAQLVRRAFREPPTRPDTGPPASTGKR